MELTWLGTAGFKIRSGKEIFYLDPFFSRNRNALPVQPMKTKDIVPGAKIFISHGHFDHLMDIPEICGIELDIVKTLKPKMVIPHHHDNFYPPISQRINNRAVC